MSSWFRSWHGAPTDHKWLVIANKAKVKPGIVSAVAWALLDHASQADDRGSVSGFDPETYAAFSGFDELDIAGVVKAMSEKGVIVGDRLAAWDKRQPKRENENDTPDKQRERKRAQRSRQVTQQDSNVTACHSMSQHVTDTDQNRTDLPTNVGAQSALSPSLSEQFHTLLDELQTANNKAAKLAEVYALCFGAAHVPDFGYLGKTAKQVNGAGRLAQLMFELVTRPPAGDILAYIVAAENNRKAHAKQNGRGNETVNLRFTNGDGEYDE